MSTMIAVAILVAAATQVPSTLVVHVRSGSEPIVAATVASGDQRADTDASGNASLRVIPGRVTVIVQKEGFLSTEHTIELAATTATLAIELVPAPNVEEEVVVVASTRTGRRVEDQPTRVEVLGREEIEEKMLMTPGDIVMLLNEMGGLRVQATSPSIGAASVRVQGMRGRYTRVLSDGLPLFGQQVGGLGLLQVPPMDLGQVEVIKGAASAFYGAGAMGGVVNLLTRRPAERRSLDLLVNQSTLGATDAVAFLATPLDAPWSLSVLTSGHRQAMSDRDEDDWVDVAGYERGVLRPRLFWNGDEGRSGWVTAGATVEHRRGGTRPGTTLRATGNVYQEALNTRRFDLGGNVQTLLGNRYIVTFRGAAAWQQHDHQFGEIRERDRHDTSFSEVAMRGAAGPHTWVLGTAYEHDRYSPTDVPQFAYGHHVVGAFVQDDVDVRSWLSLSLGARLDWHNEFGTFISPRLAALFRSGSWTSRVSIGRGFSAATPLTEETEAAGLARLQIPRALTAERGSSVSLDLTRLVGPASITATVFGSRVANAVVVTRAPQYSLFNAAGAATNLGAELLMTIRREPWVATSTYTYVRSRERVDVDRQDTPLTPRHSAGLVGRWEDEEVGRVGLELYFTGRQRLENNPYRTASAPYVIAGLLAEKRVGRVRVFVNAENITNVRQTRWDSLLLPARGLDGRWTVDAWAPLDGRAVNGGVRLGF